MSEDKKKNIINVPGLGEVEITKEPGKDKDGNPTGGVAVMSQAALLKFYEEQGIVEPKKVFKAIDDARTVFAENAVEFLGEKVKADKSDWELRAGTGNGRHIVAIDAEKQVRNVSTGEVSTRYGVVTMKIACKAPTNNEKINKVTADIDAAMRAAAGL